MADGKLPLACDLPPNVTRHCIVRVQGSCWHFRALHGCRSNVWAHGRYTGESPLSVSRAILWKAPIHLFEVDRAYPTSGMFAVCRPDVPCITPGTYAFLGAAAALRYVVVKAPWPIVDNDVFREVGSCASPSRSWSLCLSSLAL
jgi:hypothetical protein